MSLPRYSEYKQSGSVQLGLVPAGWIVSVLKRYASASSGADSKDDSGCIPLYGANGVIGKAAFSSYPKGALLIGRVGSAGAVTYVSESCAVSDNALVLIACNKVNERFLYYFLIAADLNFDISKNAQPLITATNLLARPFALPSHAEQISIVAFLDRETAKIDALIAEQEKLITLLAEKCQATISHAVTRGLDPNVSLKDSGVPWLGKVPAHWSITRIKAVSEFTTSGPRGWSEFIADQGSLFIQSGDLDDNLGIDFDSAKRVSVVEDADALRTRLKTGDVVVCITGAKTGNVAVCRDLAEVANVNQHLCLIRPLETVNSHFLAVALKGYIGKVQFEIYQYGLKQGLSLENVRELVLVLPPRAEQDVIVELIDREKNQLADLIIAAEHAIDLLKERRAALISAAVTGKIDVRQLQNL